MVGNAVFVERSLLAFEAHVHLMRSVEGAKTKSVSEAEDLHHTIARNITTRMYGEPLINLAEWQSTSGEMSTR